MRKSRKNASFFVVLIKSYIYFTLLVAVVLLALFATFTVISDKAYQEAKIEKLPKQMKELKNENYNTIKTKKIFGKTGYFDILDESDQIIYTSKETVRASYTSEELSCISDYGFGNMVYLNKLRNKENKSIYMLQYYKGTGDLYEAAGVILLDAQYRVIYDSMDTGRKFFTKEEISLLSTTEYTIEKLSFETLEGKKRTMVMYIRYLDYESWEKARSLMIWIIPIFAIIYMVTIAVFVMVIHRKIELPLQLLNHAMMDFAQKGVKSELAYNGPEEFVQICENFNNMSTLLLESEREKEQLAKDKQKMLADISHDLKTPITVIKGYAKAICDGMVDEDKKEKYMATIYEKANGLTELINTFYEYNKLEHPDFQLVFTRKDICEEIREYLAAKYEEIDEHGFLLEAEIPEEPIVCSFDAMLMRRVYDNLIGNSMKHNKKGTTIFFELEQKERNTLIRIGDNGVGIPLDMEQDVFEAFVVGDDSRNNKHGSGLGLAIVKRIITAHDGNIALVSHRKEGFSSEFLITLPNRNGES
ncbi:MAG: hypothetical protein PWP24_207 [Clostridiales bacterium]|nr:hypothetical protein [Clostridiales bacterium]